jgi:sigma-B regulation protein RsbU (phosphoserine phosphatase)
MPDIPAPDQTVLEVISPDSSRHYVQVNASPFLIGRGGDTGNHLQLIDRRISRHCAAIVSRDGCYYLEDLGQRWGIFVNGEQIENRALADGDVITFGLADSYQLIFHAAGCDTSIQNLLSRIGSATGKETGSGGLGKLNLLLQATLLLHAQIPLDTVLSTMLDHAIALTQADRGLLVEPDSTGSLRVRLGRSIGNVGLAPEALAPSQTALRQALQQQSSVITEDLAQADFGLQAAHSIVAQRLRSIVAIPLYTTPRASSVDTAIVAKRGELLGVVYLDSRRPAAFSKLDRQILDALGVEAAGILDNARLVERERERQRLDQEIQIARDIQQALLPRGFRDFPHLEAAGVNYPCLTVGGDYFDLFPVSDDRTAFLIADVSGKGLGAALLTTMLQGAFSGMSVGVDPARIFTRVNCFLCEHSDVGRYATLFFGILDTNGDLEFINAGHPSPLLLRRDGIAEPFTEGSFPIGLIPGAEYVATRAKLQPGDVLVLFSDGVTEAMDPDDELFGLTRLREVLSGQHEASLELVQKSVLDSVENFTRGASQADDITLFLIRYRGAAQVATA